MEIKATLQKPYDDEQRCSFIVEQNYQNGYKIEEADNALLAWGYTEEEKEQQEEEHINNLIMTALDFIGVLEKFGLDYVTEIKPFLDTHQELDKQLKYCQNVWCGVAKQVFAIPIKIGDITITSKMVEQAFKDKYNVKTDNIQN